MFRQKSNHNELDQKMCQKWLRQCRYILIDRRDFSLIIRDQKMRKKLFITMILTFMLLISGCANQAAANQAAQGIKSGGYIGRAGCKRFAYNERFGFCTSAHVGTFRWI